MSQLLEAIYNDFINGQKADAVKKLRSNYIHTIDLLDQITCAYGYPVGYSLARAVIETQLKEI